MRFPSPVFCYACLPMHDLQCLGKMILYTLPNFFLETWGWHFVTFVTMRLWYFSWTAMWQPCGRLGFWISFGWIIRHYLTSALWRLIRVVSSKENNSQINPGMIDLIVTKSRNPRHGLLIPLSSFGMEVRQKLSSQYFNCANKHDLVATFMKKNSGHCDGVLLRCRSSKSWRRQVGVLTRLGLAGYLSLFKDREPHLRASFCPCAS